MRTQATKIIILAVAIGALGCARDVGPGREPGEGSVASAVQPKEVAGLYRVSGRLRSREGHLRRPVRGYVSIRKTSRGYASSYLLTTGRQQLDQFHRREFLAYGRIHAGSDGLEEVAQIEVLRSRAIGVLSTRGFAGRARESTGQARTRIVFDAEGNGQWTLATEALDEKDGKPLVELELRGRKLNSAERTVRVGGLVLSASGALSAR